jgi:hypothetical protein
VRSGRDEAVTEWDANPHPKRIQGMVLNRALLGGTSFGRSIVFAADEFDTSSFSESLGMLMEGSVKVYKDCIQVVVSG